VVKIQGSGWGNPLWGRSSWNAVSRSGFSFTLHGDATLGEKVHFCSGAACVGRPTKAFGKQNSPIAVSPSLVYNK